MGRKVDFYEANHSMSRNLGKKVELVKDGVALKNPWRTSVPCIVAASVIVMREVRLTGCGPNICIRALTGMELMQLMGWDFVHTEAIDYTSDTYDCNFLTSLAGNAFSGFCCLPAAMFATSALGLLPDQPGVVDEPIEMEVSSEGSSSSDESTSG